MEIKNLRDFLNKDLNELYLKYEDTVHLQFNDILSTHENYVVVEFYGGINGNGKWTDYLKAISELFTAISHSYKCWLVDLKNDCLDDVFYLNVGIQFK